MKPTIVNVLGMELERWKHKSCTADFGVGDDWATLYHIESDMPNKGHATHLLTEAKKHYAAKGKTVGGTFPLSASMAHLYKKLQYHVYA